MSYMEEKIEELEAQIESLKLKLPEEPCDGCDLIPESGPCPKHQPMAHIWFAESYSEATRRADLESQQQFRVGDRVWYVDLDMFDDEEITEIKVAEVSLIGIAMREVPTALYVNAERCYRTREEAEEALKSLHSARPVVRRAPE